MLPILAYNTMEGGSNQFNNNPSPNFGLFQDENIILNSVRSRKKVTELANCPVCSCTVRQGELESHLNLEVDRLQKLSSAGNKRKLSSNVNNLAMPGSSASVDLQDDESIAEVCPGPSSDVFQRVHSNRMRRLRSRSRRCQSPPQTGECPVCNATLPTSKLQRHALRCLKRTGADVDEDVPDTSSEEGSIDVENDELPTESGGLPNEEHATESGGGFGAEYRWCGEWRVRATALQETRNDSHTAIRRASNDDALVVDDDEDAKLYGPPQYSPSRIAPEPDPADTQTSQNVTPTNDTTANDSIMSLSDSAGSDIKEQHMEVKKVNGIVEASAETRIQALKVRIKELESKQNTATELKCLICLSPYASPAVSIQCWHVYCEVCWLDSLRAKKICPQCNAITNTHHLRRIYM